METHTLSIKIAQKPYTIGSLGPKALKYESFDAKGYFACRVVVPLSLNPSMHGFTVVDSHVR